MTKETQIYAKQQQILLVDNILDNLCPAELTTDGRKYLKKMKDRIKDDLLLLKSRLIESNVEFR